MFIIFYLFLSQMAGDKRKGKAIAEQKKKSRQQKEWERVLAVSDTQGQPQRGIRIQRAHRVRGSSPRVGSSSSSQRSIHGSSSSHVGQAEGTRPQSRQSHLPHSSEESCNRGAHRERAAGSRPLATQKTTSRAFGVYLHDLRHLPGPKIQRLRSVREDQWFQ
jgi:hypothetical protein